MERMTVCAVLLAVLVTGEALAQTEPVEVRLLTDKAEAVLHILDKRAAGARITEADWERLFETDGYVRLKRRESERSPFEDSAFKSFVLSPELLTKRSSLGEALARWSTIDVMEPAQRAFAYLPEHARIRVKVYPSIKPRSNTFVFEPRTDPAIFFYLDPEITSAKFDNTLAQQKGLAATSSVAFRGRTWSWRSHPGWS